MGYKKQSDEDNRRAANSRPIEGQYPNLAIAVRELLGWSPGSQLQFLSARKASRLSGVNYSTIAAMARGERASEESVRKFSKGLDGDLDKLLVTAGYLPDSGVSPCVEQADTNDRCAPNISHFRQQVASEVRRLLRYDDEANRIPFDKAELLTGADRRDLETVINGGWVEPLLLVSIAEGLGGNGSDMLELAGFTRRSTDLSNWTYNDLKNEIYRLAYEKSKLSEDFEFLNKEVISLTHEIKRLQSLIIEDSEKEIAELRRQQSHA